MANSVRLLILAGLALLPLSPLGAQSAVTPASTAAPKPAAAPVNPFQVSPEERQRLQKLTNEDHTDMLAQLGITRIRPGRNGNPKEGDPNAANYDQAKANPFPDWPDVLTLKNGTKVTSAEGWWKQRRTEIAEDFEREVVGRIPANVPKVTWEVTETVNTANTSTTLTANPNPSTYGGVVTFTATVTSTGATPTGTVTFTDGTTVIGTGTLNNGQATLSLGTLTAGTHSVTASYAATTNFTASTSTAVSETVDPATVLYVDRNNSSCTDTGSNAGTIATPFCTISAAASKATAGFTVIVATGTYSERVSVANSGTSTAPITFTPAAGASVTVTGATNGFLISSKSWITIRGFSVTPAMLSMMASVSASGRCSPSTSSKDSSSPRLTMLAATKAKLLFESVSSSKSSDLSSEFTL